jgi:RNA polymerase sigma-70 factor (ECF subfamily)
LIFVLTFATEGERDKFSYLYDKYKNLMFYKAWDVLHDHMLAEDAVSEAYIRVYRNLDKIDDPDSPRSAAFLITIVRNTALSILSRGRMETANEPDETCADPLDLEASVLSDIESEKLFVVIGKLDEQQRNIFVLKYAYDLSHSEIAKQLNITENNVTVKLHRARKKLVEIISAEASNE